MQTKHSAKVLLASAALVGLLGGTTVRLQAATFSNGGDKALSNANAGQLADDADQGKHGCKGKNSCKGQGGCKTSDAGCKAKNTCKGKGGCATDGSKG